MGNTKSSTIARIMRVVMLAMMVAGCTDVPLDDTVADTGADPSAGTAVAAEPLNGTITFPDASCTSAQQARIIKFGAIARANLISLDMVKCLRSHGLSATDGESAETILNQMAENVPTQARCEHLSAAASSKIGISHEEVTFNTTWLDQLFGTNTDAEMAAILVHEVAHNKGYEHGTTAGGTSSEYAYTVPLQLEACSNAISTASYGYSNVEGRIADADGQSVFEQTRAAVLGPVGGDGGSATRDTCGNGRFVSGLRGGFSLRVDALAPDCKNFDGFGTLGTTTLRGGTGGTAFDDQCPAGQLMVGLLGFADNLVRQVRVMCASVTAIANYGLGSVYWGPIRGSTTGQPFARWCPGGQAVKALRLRSGAAIDNITMECQSVAASGNQAEITLARAGSTDGSHHIERCPVGAVMTGISGRSGSEVDRVGGTCNQVVDQGNWITLVNYTGIVVPGHGGWNGSPWQGEYCPANSALVGFEFRSGGRLDSIRGICANARLWVGGGVNADSSRTWLNAHGGSGGGLSTVQCPYGYYVHGWTVWDSNIDNSRRVFGIQPICVRGAD